MPRTSVAATASSKSSAHRDADLRLGRRRLSSAVLRPLRGDESKTQVISGG